MEPDAEIISAVLNGQPERFRVLVRRYERATLGTALAVLGDFHAAEDAAQNAFLMAYQNLDSLRKRDAFGAWVLKIARREALRMARARPHTAEAELNESSARFGQHGTDPLSQQRRELLEAVMKLPEHERRTVMLYYFDGHTAPEIARINDLSVGTVTKRLSRARNRLRERMEGVGDGK